MTYIPPERTPRKRGPDEPKEEYDEYLREFREEQQPKVVYLDWLYTQSERDEMEYNAIHRRILRLFLSFIDWLNKVYGETDDDPLGFVGAEIRTHFGLKDSLFNYGNRFQVLSYNKRKQSYTVLYGAGREKTQMAFESLVFAEAEIVGKIKPKHKTNGEQMDSISDLFEGYEDEEHPDWKLACAMDRYFENKIKTTPQQLGERPGDGRTDQQ